MPRISWAEYLVGYLFEFGPVSKDGAWEAGDVNEVERLLKVQFQPWESRALVKLSREYQGQLHAATKPEAPCPWPEVAWQYRRAKMLNMERQLDAFCK